MCQMVAEGVRVYEIHKSQRQHNPLSFISLSLLQEILCVKLSLDLRAKCLDDSLMKQISIRKC